MDFSWMGAGILGVITFVTGLFGTVPATVQQAVESAPEQVAQFSEMTLTKIASTTAPAQSAGLPAGSAWKTALPLGDGKYVTTGAKKGYVYICNRASGGGGAQVAGSWIHGTTWNPTEKIQVQGAVEWPNASYRMTVSGGTRTIATNDLPTDHTTGIYPVQKTDPAYQIDRNPSSITAQNYTFTLPAYPTPDSSANCMYGMVGVMNNGVLLFNAFDAEYRDALAHEVQDSYDGHPNQSGYHKHGFISAIQSMKIGEVVGFAFDGYPITGPLLPNGNYVATADLDECHGMESEVLLDGKMVRTYHYVLTQDFPYSVGCFKGKSYEPTPGRAGGGAAAAQGAAPTQPAAGGTPPQEAVSACTGKSAGASCSFTVPRGTLSGTCNTPPGQSLACLPR